MTYSIKYRNYQRAVRGRQIVRAEKLAENPSSLSRKKENDPKRFVIQEHCTTDGEAAEKTITSLDQNRIDNEMKYDGFYAVCTNLEDDVSDIIRINQKRWEIEECFRIMKTEFKARPVYLRRNHWDTPGYEHDDCARRGIYPDLHQNRSYGCLARSIWLSDRLPDHFSEEHEKNFKSKQEVGI